MSFTHARYASKTGRIVTTIIDHIILIIVIQFVTDIVPLFNDSNTSTFRILSRESLISLTATGELAAICLYFGYFVGTEYFFGATLAKRLLYIEITDLKGNKMTFKQALIRTAFRALELMPVILPIGVWVIIISPSNRRLGDYLAKTACFRRAKQDEHTSKQTI